MDNILKANILGEKMQKYTAIFAIRFLTRAFLSGIISPTTENRWKETRKAIQSYFKSTSYKKYGLQTLGWSLLYIFDGIKRKIS